MFWATNWLIVRRKKTRELAKIPDDLNSLYFARPFSHPKPNLRLPRNLSHAPHYLCTYNAHAHGDRAEIGDQEMKSLPRAVRKSRKISPQNIQPYPSPTSILKFAGCNFKLAAVFLLLLAKGLCRGKKLYLIFLLSSSPNACRRRRCYRMCGYLFLTRDCGLLITILFLRLLRSPITLSFSHALYSFASFDRSTLSPSHHLFLCYLSVFVICNTNCSSSAAPQCVRIESKGGGEAEGRGN